MSVWLPVAVGALTFILGVGVQEWRRNDDQRRDDRLREAAEAREDRLRFHTDRLAAASGCLAASQSVLESGQLQGIRADETVAAMRAYNVTAQRMMLLYGNDVRGAVDHLSDSIDKLRARNLSGEAEYIFHQRQLALLKLVRRELGQE